MADEKPRQPKDISSPDMSFIRDMVEIIKTKLLFFFPFFGAYIAFLVSKNDYVSGASIVVQLFCLASFGMGLLYAYNVFQVLWLLQSIRFIFTVDRISNGTFIVAGTIEEKETLSKLMKQLGPAVAHEGKLYRRTMYLLYLTAGTVLFNIYFGKILHDWTVKLLSLIFMGR